MQEAPGLKGISYFIVGTINDAALEKLRHNESLVYLQASGRTVTDASVPAIATIPNLNSLSLEHTQITGVGMRALAALKHLRSVAITYSEVGDTGLTEVCDLHEIEHLNISHNHVVRLSPLEKLQKLRTLDISGNAVLPETLSSLRCLANLRELCILDTGIAPSDLEQLRGSKINQLIGNFSYDANSWCDAIARNLPSISELRFHGASLDSRGVASIGTCSRLQTLSLGSPLICDNDLKALMHLDALRELNLSGTGITGAGLKYLSFLRLHDLNLSGITLGRARDFNGSPLSGLPRTIVSLSLNRNHLSQADLKAIATLPNLQSLSLMECEIEEGLDILRSCQRLQCLKLQGVRSANLYQQLCRLGNIKSIEITGATISDKDVVTLRHRLAPRSNVQ